MKEKRRGGNKETGRGASRGSTGGAGRKKKIPYASLFIFIGGGRWGGEGEKEKNGLSDPDRGAPFHPKLRRGKRRVESSSFVLTRKTNLPFFFLQRG